jgi:hypothetical protein
MYYVSAESTEALVMEAVKSVLIKGWNLLPGRIILKKIL